MLRICTSNCVVSSFSSLSSAAVKNDSKHKLQSKADYTYIIFFFSLTLVFYVKIPICFTLTLLQFYKTQKNVINTFNNTLTYTYIYKHISNHIYYKHHFTLAMIFKEQMLDCCYIISPVFQRRMTMRKMMTMIPTLVMMLMLTMMLHNVIMQTYQSNQQIYIQTTNKHKNIRLLLKSLHLGNQDLNLLSDY